MISRRRLIKLFGIGGALPLLGVTRLAWAADNRVVVVGGGAAGTIFAKYLKILLPQIDITIVEKNKIYYPAFVSNHLINGLRDKDTIQYSYKQLNNSGINIVHDKVTEIDPVSKKVSLAIGSSLPYDRLVLAQGIGLDKTAIQGLDVNTLHAWTAGEQVQSFASQVAGLKQGGVVIVAIPSGSISGPWAPFERVSQIAAYFSLKNKKAKVILLNGNSKPEELPLFENYWKKHYPNMIELQWKTSVNAIAGNSVTTSAGNTVADLLNIVAPNRAASLAEKAGLTDASGWCPVDQGTFKSVKLESIHVIGDAINPALGLSKTAQSANAQAKLCAIAMANELEGKKIDLQNLPPLIDSEYAILGNDYGVFRTKVFRISNDKKLTQVSHGQSQIGDPQKQGRREVLYAQSWYNNITHEMFE